MRKFISCFIIVLIGVLQINAQHSNLFLGKNFSSNFDYLIYKNNANYHTSFKPIIKSDLNFDIDSILEKKSSLDSENWYLKKIFSEHFIILDGDGYYVSASPLMNLSVGKEKYESKNTFDNTRGYIIEGHLGKKLSYSSSFVENQSIFPNYVDGFIRNNKVVPGQGYARNFKETGFDYAMSSGYISYRYSKMFAAQFGHGKHFIGDGYRSLLLSDNGFNYPYLRLQTTFGKFQYTNLYTEFQDINYFSNNGIDNYDQMGYAKKYMSAHYLNYNASTRFSISLFEAVIWRMNHAPGSSGFDVNYLNPIIMFRPVEYSLNSPDNVLVGINTKYKLPFSSYLYGQLVLDEFSLNDLKENNDFWANKFGYQIGYKVFNLLGVSNLTFQTEYNFVRPYTYAHHNPQQNYAHYNQPLAHPLGANFSETLFLTEYKWKRFEFRGKIMFTKYGAKVVGDDTSYGNDLYMSTGNFAEESGFLGVGSGRPDRDNDGFYDEYGMYMYQGNKTNVNLQSVNISYLVNPRTNLKFDLGITIRNFKNEDEEMKTQFVNFGIVSDLFNRYYDF